MAESIITNQDETTHECCNPWWEGLSNDRKMYIHYYFHDIKKQPDRTFKYMKKSHDLKIKP